MGHEYIEAVTIEDGVSLALSERPDLILLHRDFYKYDQFVEERANNFTLAQISTVIMLAHQLEEREQRKLEESFDGYIHLPVSVEVFPQQVDRYLNKNY